MHLVLACAALPACFRGDFLDNTCERLPGGCPDTGETGPTSTGPPPADMGPQACVPDPQPPAIQPPADGELQDGPGFRITKMQIVDPNFYFPLGNACIEVTGTVGDAVTDSLAKWETNLVFMARQFDPAAAEQPLYFIRDATCDQNANYCAYGKASAGYPFTVVNQDEGDCHVDIALNSADPEDILALSRPIAPCFRSPEASFEVALIPNAAPLRMYFAQFAAKYEPDDCNPDRLLQGVMTGFVRREDALATEYFVDDFGVTVNLWQVILGSDANTCTLETGKRTSVDAVWFPVPGEPKKRELALGVFLYINIEAERLPVYELP